MAKGSRGGKRAGGVLVYDLIPYGFVQDRSQALQYLYLGACGQFLYGDTLQVKQPFLYTPCSQ